MKHLILLTALLFAGSISSQNDMRQLRQLCMDDNSSLRTVLSCPDSMRQMVYIAATYPQAFIKLSELQQKSSAAFKNMASAYGRNRQKQLWDVSRYPELIALLLENRYKPKKELKLMLAKYPEETRRAALFCVRNYSTLMEMDEIRRDFGARASTLIATFPGETQLAFTNLLKDPELFALLTDDLVTTITLGEHYKSNAAAVKQFGDSVHAVLAEEERREYEDWKAGINSDPSVQQELKKVSKKYATETGDDIYDENGPQPSVVINIHPYPYWAGYPYWYQYPYWRPYPWWYDMGFYWSPGGAFVFTGLPSYRFGWWYYGSPYYHRHFYRTSHYFDHHYQGHPHSRGGFNRGIRDRSRHAPVQRPRTTGGGGNH